MWPPHIFVLWRPGWEFHGSQWVTMGIPWVATRFVSTTQLLAGGARRWQWCPCQRGCASLTYCTFCSFNTVTTCNWLLVVWGHMEEGLNLYFSHISFFLVLWWRHRVGRLLLVVLVPPAPVVRFSDLPYVAVTTGGTQAQQPSRATLQLFSYIFLSVQWLAFPGFQ